MCGIAGFISTPRASEAASALDAVRRMTDRMSTSGPDAGGVWASEGVALGQRRLAILDMDARANQPMVFTDGATPSSSTARSIVILISAGCTSKLTQLQICCQWRWAKQ